MDESEITNGRAMMEDSFHVAVHLMLTLSVEILPARQLTSARDHENCFYFDIILSDYSATFWEWLAHLCFGLGRGSISFPGPAMALTGRLDLNSTKKSSDISKLPIT